MGTNVNSLKGILLFAVRNGYREVRVAKGLLPLMVSSTGETAYLNGIAPISGDLIANIKRDYMANNSSLILTISEQEFMASGIGDDLIFRHLPLINHDKNIGTKLASALYAKKGMVVITASNKELRFLKLYKVAAYLVENRSVTMAIIEKNKFYTIAPVNSKLINIHRPEIELNSLIRISGSIDYDCLMIPDINEEDAIRSIEAVAQEKLVLISCTWENAQKINKTKIIYSDYSEGEAAKNSLKANVRINKEVLHA